LLKRAIEEHAMVDDRLGKSFQSDISNKKAAEALITLATAHAMAARTLLKLAIGNKGAAEVFYMHADELATEPD
jgi:hypothetical protein